MLRAKLIGREKIQLEKVNLPLPKEGEVQIKVKFCGICGSDIHAYQGKHPFVHPPIVLGHEFSGTVSRVGLGVADLKEGDPVTVEPNITCGRCYNCLHGRYNICSELKVIGCVGYDGAFSEYILVPSSKVIKLPRGMSFEHATMIEPAAVAVHVVRKASQKIGQKVVVLGAGPIGLLVTQIARSAGADGIIVTDILDYRLNLARRLGADEVVNISSQDLKETIIQKWGTEGVDLIYDCVGTEETLFQAMQVARKGIKIMIVGVPHQKIEINFELVQDRELELMGCLMYVREDFLTALSLILNDRIDVDSLITHRFNLEKIGEAFSLIQRKKEEIIKILIKT